jgi:UDP:flavonoid glycosyltransferase YjiC (YdhE family)
VRPVAPNYKVIGPPLPKERKQIPVELQEWLDQGPVIYMSFGTIAVVLKDQVESLLEGLTSSKFRVLWSCSSDQQTQLPTKLPSNFRIEPFVPQLEVLGHKNVKLFITHGGFGSVHESLAQGKPMIIMPFFTDQVSNRKYLLLTLKKFIFAFKIADRGIGMNLDKTSFTPLEVSDKVHQLLNDPSYTLQAERFQRVIAGGNSAKRAADAIEEVIIAGTSHLLDETIRLPWYKRAYFDVYAIFGFVIFAIIFGWYLFLKFMYLALKNNLVYFAKVQ